MGRQAIRTLFSPTAVTIHSVFDSDGRRIAEYNETSGALIREYIWNGWEPVAVVEGGVVSFVRTDHIGRPVFATNSTGAKVWEVSYLPFGEVIVATGSPTAARFPGQWFQTESGLHQNWMRDYDPTTGRYIEPDPLGLIDGASVYGYVKENPGRWIDPRGEDAIEGAIAAGIATSVADGPLPFGEAVGLCLVGAAVLYCAAGGNYCTTTNDCDAAFEAENNVCRMLYDQSSRRKCFVQAQENYARCLRNAN